MLCPPTACQGPCDNAGACQEREAARPAAGPCNQCDPIGFCNTSCAAKPAKCPPCSRDCREGRDCPASLARFALVTTNPHGRLVDTEIHEAPKPARACQPEPIAPPMLAFFRLLKHYRASGQAFFPAVARAWAKRK